MTDEELSHHQCRKINQGRQSPSRIDAASIPFILLRSPKHRGAVVGRGKEHRFARVVRRAAHGACVVLEYVRDLGFYDVPNVNVSLLRALRVSQNET